MTYGYSCFVLIRFYPKWVRDEAPNLPSAYTPLTTYDLQSKSKVRLSFGRTCKQQLHVSFCAGRLQRAPTQLSQWLGGQARTKHGVTAT